MNYSVLMSVYYKEKPEYLTQSMNSMFEQSVPTDDFVLVCDGPLNAELDAVIKDMCDRYPNVLNVVRLEENVGLGKALQIGVLECRHEIIARMDSDDISRKHRCETELKYLEQHPEVAIVGTIIEEFTGSVDHISARRVVPEDHDDIISFAKKRNPFNHPSVMYRKQAVLSAGNYQDVRYMQDYYLWFALLSKGFIGHNIQEALVWMRADANLFKRRSGKLYIEIQLNLFKRMRECGFITYPQYIKTCFIRTCSGMAPNWIREFMFKRILRKK